MVDTTEVR